MVCGALALAGWWRLLRATPLGLGGRAPLVEWHAGDAIFGGALALFFLFNILADDGKPIVLTPELIRDSSIGYAVITGLVATLVFGRGLSPQKAFGLWPSQPLRVVALAVACIVLTLPIVILAEELTSLLGHSASDGDDMVRYLRGQLSLADSANAIVLAVIIAPITEEVVFRGYLYGVIKKYGGQVAAMATTALLFAAVHQNIPAIPALFLLAVGFTLAYELTGSLWAPILMHMLYNLVQVIVLMCFPEWASKI